MARPKAAAERPSQMLPPKNTVQLPAPRALPAKTQRGLAVHWVRAVISARSRFTVRGQVQHRRLRALRSSRMVRSVPPGVRMRRVWVTSRPSGRDMVTTMLEVMTNTSIRTAP